MLSLQWPWMLLLLPLPWVVKAVLPEYKHQPVALRVPFYEQLKQGASQTISQISFPFSTVVALIMWVLLVVAVSRPIWYGEPVNVETSGRDLMLAIDLSDSMKIEDMQSGSRLATRLDTVKQLAGEFIERRRGDRMGLILFGQRSYLQTPLTFDSDSVVVQLKEALPGFAGSSTALGDAIGMAISTLRDRPAASRVLVLLTDGANTAGTEPAEAVQVAVESAIRIHTIGVGANSKRIIDVTGGERTIDPSRDLDESTLQYIAQKTGGRYFRAHNPSELASIYTYIDKLEPAPEQKSLRPQRSLYHWPLALSLLSCLSLMLLRGRLAP